MIGPKLIHKGPSTTLIAYWIGRFTLWLMGWNVKGNLPSDKKFILTGSPHTSNWDFPIGLAAVYVFRLKVSWVGKHTLFHWPYGWFMTWLGGIPVIRDSAAGVVDQMAQKLNKAEKLVLVLAPSATRKKKEYWKSGFYRIALKAQVPIVCGRIDFENKEAEIGLRLMPSGNTKKDMDQIRAYYKAVKGRHPQQMTPIRLKEESNL